MPILNAATPAEFGCREALEVRSTGLEVATDLVETPHEHPDPAVIRRAAGLVRSGGVVAVPSDALYTIVADPFNLAAVGKVFRAKGREPQRSLPLLISDLAMAEDLSRELTSRFYLLARRFWPGPLTVIVPAASKVPFRVTGNTGRLALRQSRSPLIQALLEELDQPAISTSANRSGTPTCRTAIDVFGTMDGRIDLVVDGGPCMGEGATTIDITEPFYRIIRSGAISRKQIEECLRVE